MLDAIIATFSLRGAILAAVICLIVQCALIDEAAVGKRYREMSRKQKLRSLIFNVASAIGLFFLYIAYKISN